MYKVIKIKYLERVMLFDKNLIQLERIIVYRIAIYCFDVLSCTMNVISLGNIND